jgi:phthiocerol/phenolphthiocerol synthesis type-I polyketide synthase E
VLPFLCGQITVLAPLPAQILAWTPPVHADGDVQVRDVDIFDPDGQRLLVRVRSYAQRLVSVEDFAQRLGPVRPVRVTPADAAPPVDEPIGGEVSSGGSGDSPDGSSDVDDMTAVIRTLWSDALGVADIGLDDDFFDLGGNSLTAVQLTGWLAERLRVELDVGLLFEASTIRHLVAALSPAGEPDSR